MIVNLTPEQEVLVARAIQAGVIDVPDEVFELGMQLVRQRLEAQSSVALTAETWSRDFHHWVHSHSPDGLFLSDQAISRESIYGPTGE